jgi:hypothetical protein
MHERAEVAMSELAPGAGRALRNRTAPRLRDASAGRDEAGR